MPRAPLIRTSRFVYHVTSRSNHPEWFYLPLRPCWDVFTKQLSRTVETYRLEIGLLVLMSNHFHLLVSTPDANIDLAMRHFISGVTREVQRRTGRINHIFGGRYRRSVLENGYALGYAYKYVARNPVRAGICHRVDEYPFSTMNDRRCGVPLVEGVSPYWGAIPRQPDARLRWLNTGTGSDSERLVGRALRRDRFRFTTESNLQRPLRALRSEYGVEPQGASSGTFQY